MVVVALVGDREPTCINFASTFEELPSRLGADSMGSQKLLVQSICN